MIKAGILLATSNPGKAAEIGAALAGLPLEVFSLETLQHRSLFLETGTSFLDNARGKGLFYSRQTAHLTLAEDSGLEVEFLGGAPGVYSARFSGPGATDEKNIRKVLRLLRGVPPEKRKARYVCRLVLARNGCIIKETRGRVRGKIMSEKRGGLGFGYDPIFYYHPFRRTFGEIPLEEKNRISHRGRALRQMKSFLLDYLRVRCQAP